MTAINQCFTALHNSASHASSLLGHKNILWEVAVSVMKNGCTAILWWSDLCVMQLRKVLINHLPLWLYRYVLYRKSKVYPSSLTQSAKGKLHGRFTYLYPNALIRERSALSVIICSLASPCEGSQVKGILEFLHKNDTQFTFCTYPEQRHQKAVQ